MKTIDLTVTLVPSQEGFARKAKHQKTQSSGAKHSHLLERAALLTAIL
jgi:hypothetical protein